VPELASFPRRHITRPTAWLATARARSASLPTLVLVVILAAGATLRSTGSDWDRGAHLHPDERYLSIVADNVDWPSSVGGYFDVERSPLSPYNTEAGRVYVYGQLPLLATKALATLTGRDSYDELYLVGRHVSAFLDTVSIGLVFLLGMTFMGRFGRRAATWGSVLAAAFYAVSVLAIQHAHFFTVESWLVATTLLAFYLGLVVVRRPLDADFAGSLGLLAATGSAVALAAASKASGLLVLLPVILALVMRAGPGVSTSARLASIAGSFLAVAAAGYVTFRLVSPYAFEHSSWLDPEPSAQYRAALEEQARLLGGEGLYPPTYQWLLSDRFVDPLWNLVVWGMGLPLGLAGLAGVLWLAVLAARDVRVWAGSTSRSAALPAASIMLIFYVAVTFAYFGSLFAHSIRYLFPIVPFLSVTAAFAVVGLHRRNRNIGFGVAVGLGAAALAYAVAFEHVYRHPHTRTAASEWIATNAPPGSTIVNEHWDDGLPIGESRDMYTFRELPVFDVDDASKLRKLYAGLAGADYYVVSSPRASATIGRLPDRFPLMSRFYRLLAEERLGFRRAAEFTSYPELFGVTLVDSGADEAFWVYDHPPVVVYERTEPLSWPGFRRTLCSYGPAPGCVRNR